MKLLRWALVLVFLRASCASVLRLRGPDGAPSSGSQLAAAAPAATKPFAPLAFAKHGAEMGAPPDKAPVWFRKQLRLGLATIAALLLALAGWKVYSYAIDLGMLTTSKHEHAQRFDGGIKQIDSELRAKLEKGELDQPWNEELGLCGTQLGRERWYGRSEVDPANYLADKAQAHPVEDTNGWKDRGRIDRSVAGPDRSREETRIVSLHPKLLERERFVDIGFFNLLRKRKWSEESGGYPGPAFETKEEFTKGTRARRWPIGLEGTEDTRVADLRTPQLAAHLRDFIWRNNSEGSFKASLVMIFLGSVPFVQNFLAGKVIEVISPPVAAAFLSVDAKFAIWMDTKFAVIALALCVLEVLSHYVSFRFWTIVPKYGVLRQFQSFFGRRMLQIQMTQATPKDNRLKCAHEDRFRDSPGMCQAMTNYCCEAVVLNLWGKSFDYTRAKTTLATSILLLFYVMMFESAAGATMSSPLSKFCYNFIDYGWYIVLFMLLSFAMFSFNVLSRVQNSVDFWGVATKTKLNMFSLQQELTHRIMTTGKRRQGAPMSDEDQKILDEACSDWHDSCRIYGNRDFHTWFASWIQTAEFNNMLNSLSILMCTLVLGLAVIGGHMSIGTFVTALGSVRSINSAYSSALSYHFSMPEGYVCLLYLAQVCNMIVPGEEDPEDEDEHGLGDESLSPEHVQAALRQAQL